MRRRDDEKLERRRRLSLVLISLFIVAIMVFSMIGFGNYGDSGTGDFAYGSQKFTLTQQGFQTKLDGKIVIVHDAPLEKNGSRILFQSVFGRIIEVEDTGGAATLFTNSLYRIVAFDPATPAPGIQYVEQARFDLWQSVPNTIGAVTTNSTLYPTLPVVSCADATPDMVVLTLVVTNESVATLSVNGSCITGGGDPEAILAIKDYLLLATKGVFDADES